MFRVGAGSRHGHVVQIRLALETHAQKNGTSLVELVRDVGPQTGVEDSPRSPSGPLVAASDTRFSSRQHASLVRAAGGSAADVAAAAAVAAVPCVVSSGSPPSDASVGTPTVFMADAVAVAANALPAVEAVRSMLSVLPTCDMRCLGVHLWSRSLLPHGLSSALPPAAAHLLR